MNEQYRLGLVATALGALVLLVPLWMLFRRRSAPRREQQPGRFRSYGLPYLFLLPTLFVLVMFLYYPTSRVMLSSLTLKHRWLGVQFICLENYAQLQEDPVYRDSFTTTMGVTALVVLFSLALSLAIAVLASQKIKGASIYRTFLIGPYAISPIVSGAIFYAMFWEGGIGLVNWILEGVVEASPEWLQSVLDSTLGEVLPGWPTPKWHTSSTLAPWLLVATAVWNLMGFNTLFYVAGLQNIPQDLLEAASIDGANRFTRFWRITFPLLSPFTFFLLVTNITYSFYGIYGAVVALFPRGGPVFGEGGASDATNVLISKLYQDSTGIAGGLSGAQAVILFLMVAGITILQFRFIERRVTYEGEA